MDTFFKKYYHIILLVLALIVILFGFFDAKMNVVRLLKNSRYTIATISSDWHSKNGHGFGVDYSYRVSGKSYHLTRNVKLHKGQHFLLLYDSINPRNCVLLTEYPLYDSIKPPKSGWTYKQVPIPIDSIQIKEYVEMYK